MDPADGVAVGIDALSLAENNRRGATQTVGRIADVEPTNEINALIAGPAGYPPAPALQAQHPLRDEGRNPFEFVLFPFVETQHLAQNVSLIVVYD